MLAALSSWGLLTPTAPGQEPPPPAFPAQATAITVDVVVLAEAAAAEPAVAEDRVSGLDPGRYELTLDVADRLAGRSLTAREEFMLEPAPEAGEAPSR